MLLLNVLPSARDMRYWLALIVVTWSVAAGAREVSREDRTMADGLYLAMSQGISATRFEGTYDIVTHRPSLTPQERVKGMQWLQEISLEHYEQFLTAEDHVRLRQHGVRDVSAGLKQPLIRDLVQRRIDQYWQEHADQWLLLPNPWSRQYTFISYLSRDHTHARLELKLKSSANNPAYFQEQEERESVGVADNDQCTVYLPNTRRADHMTFGHVRGAGVASLMGKPDCTNAGLPRIEGLDAEDIRVIDTFTLEGLAGKRVLVDAGDRVMVLWVLPERACHIARCDTYNLGQLETVETYSNWRKLRSGNWYPLKQTFDQIQHVEVSADLAAALKKGRITPTNLKLLERQNPTRWMHYERIITGLLEETPAEDRFRLDLPKDSTTRELPGGLAPEF